MKKLLRVRRPVKAPVLGLDVHKRVTVYCLFDAEGNVAKCGDIVTSRQDIEDLFDRVLDDSTHVALEACGLSLWIYDLFVARFSSDRIHVAASSKIRAIAESSEKNDENDAWWLAYLTYEGRLPEAYVPPHDYRQVRLAARERLEAVKMRGRAAVRLKAELAQIGEILPVESLDSEDAQNAVYEIALRVGGIVGEKLLRVLATFIRFTQERDHWSKRLEEVAKDLPETKVLEREIPGVGKTIAATIVGETGPIERFRSAKALGKFTGLVPSDRSSSGKTKHGAMTRQGSPVLRWALAQAVTHCSRSMKGPRAALRRWIVSRMRRMGKAKAKAAAARKLAVSIWHCVTKGVPFDATKAFGPEPRPVPQT